MIHFLNSNSGAIQSIMVVVLALITGVYVWDTRRLANISTKQLELLTRPLAVVGESIGIIVQETAPNSHVPAQITDFVRFIYTIKNIGQVPIKYIGHTSFNEHISKSDHEVILYPGQSLAHRTETYHIEAVNPKKIKGIASIKIVYCSLELPKQKYFFSRKFEIKENSEGYDIIDDNAGRET